MFNLTKIVQLDTIVNIINHNNNSLLNNLSGDDRNLSEVIPSAKNARFMIEGTLMSKIDLIIKENTIDDY